MVSNGEKGDFAAISAIPFCSFDRKEVIKTGSPLQLLDIQLSNSSLSMPNAASEKAILFCHLSP